MKEFECVLGHQEVKRQLYLIVDVLKNFNKYREQGVRFPKGLLLQGRPGVGKTLLASCFINAVGFKSYVVRKNTGENFIKELNDVFNSAKENAPSVVLLDDMDKYFKNENNEEYFINIQALIDNACKDNVYVIATVNDISVLPHSLIRKGRFDKEFEVNGLSGENLEKMLRFYLKDKNISDDIDYKLISRIFLSLTNAELESIINDATMNSIYLGKDKVDNKDILDAILSIFFTSPVDKKCQTSVMQERAIHEAGHVLMNELIQANSVNFATIHPSQLRIGGVVNVSTEEEDDILDCLNRIKISLSGAAAVEVLLRKKPNGCFQDFDRASATLLTLVTYENYLGIDKYVNLNYAEAGRLDIDKALKLEFLKMYEEAKVVMAKNIKFLVLCSEELIRKKVIFANDIIAIKKRARIKL